MLALRKRVKLLVKGKVQRAGYRYFVEELAEELGLTGYVKNLSDGSVEVLPEGEQRKLNEFSKKIRVKKFPINVTKIIKELSPYKDEFEYFEIRRGIISEGESEILDRADDAAKYMRLMVGEVHAINGRRNSFI